MLASRRLVRWAGPILVVILAAALRLWNLGHPHSLVFDETFYVKDAWTLVNNGYESTWPENADALFAAGNSMIFMTDASFVVHPPLGKWLIGLGMIALGPESGWGWRITTVIMGVLAVILIMLIAKKLFGSLVLATIAGFLLAIDGHAIVMSRVALLDNYVMFFALLGFGAVLMDRDWHATRLAAWLAARREAGAEPSWGPALWWRPWLLAAGFLGYVTGAGARRPRLPAALLLLLLTLALALILDLDRPRTGTITVSQRSLLELRAAMTPRP